MRNDGRELAKDHCFFAHFGIAGTTTLEAEFVPKAEDGDISLLTKDVEYYLLSAELKLSGNLNANPHEVQSKKVFKEGNCQTQSLSFFLASDNMGIDSEETQIDEFYKRKCGLQTCELGASDGRSRAGAFPVPIGETFQPNSSRGRSRR